DLDSGLLDLCVFSSARHEDWVRVVYVRVNLPARPRLAQEIKTAVAYGQVIHLARGSGARPHDGEFAVTPECAVKHDDIRSVHCVAQFAGQFADSWGEKRSYSRGVVPKLKRNAAGQFDRSKTDAAIQGLKISADLSPFDSAEPRYDAVNPRERCSRFIGRVNDQRRFLLPQEQ